MIKLKDSGVIVVGLKPEMYFALGIADRAYADEGLECIVTAGLNGDHNSGTLHGNGNAVDLSNKDCTPEQHLNILVKLQRLERYGFDVVDELPGQTAKTTASHYHLEFQPKPGEKFWRYST